MGPVDVETARVAFAGGDWATARAALEREQVRHPLAPDDLELLGRTCWWLGDTPGYLDVAADLYRARLADGDEAGGAAQALDLALAWSTEGDLVIGQAWLNRARRLLRGLAPSPTHGYLVYVDAGLAWEVDEDPGPAMEGATELRDLARRFGDESLEALAGVLSGVAAVWTGRTTEGFGDLDEAMLAVVSGAVPAQWAGDVYCTVIHLCHVLGDLVRMRAWTDALEQWAAPLSTTFMFAGITRVHQLQLLSAEGEWDVVEHEVAGRSRELVGVARLGRGGGLLASWVTCVGCVVTPSVPGRPTRARVTSASRHSPVRPCSTRPRGAAGRPSPGCGRRCPSRAGSAGLACCSPRSRSHWRRATWRSPSCPRPSWRPRPRSRDPRAAGLVRPRGCLPPAAPRRLGRRPAGAWRRRPVSTASSAAATRPHGCTSCSPVCTRVAASTAPPRPSWPPRWRSTDSSAPHPTSRGWRRTGHRVGSPSARWRCSGCVLGGASNRDVARHLVISEKTVEPPPGEHLRQGGGVEPHGAAAWGREHGVDPVRTGPAPAPNGP